MGLLDRLRGGGNDSGDGEKYETVAPVEEVGTRPPTAEESAQLDQARARYAELGIDPGDLASIEAAYGQALVDADNGDASAAGRVPVIGVAIGDYLVGKGFRWVLSTDPYGSDLAVEPARAGIPVVVGNVAAVRWMRRESGWVERVVESYARRGGRN